MARCKLTNMNLRNIRKTREYQAILIDLVRASVLTKQAAEEIMGMTIPAGLVSDVASSPAEEEPGTGTEGSGTEETGNTITLLYFDQEANDSAGEWLTAEYDLDAEESTEEAAQAAFSDDTIDTFAVVEENPEWVEGENSLDTKYMVLDPQPEVYEPGMLVRVWHSENM